MQQRREAAASAVVAGGAGAGGAGAGGAGARGATEAIKPKAGTSKGKRRLQSWTRRLLAAKEKARKASPARYLVSPSNAGAEPWAQPHP